MSLLVAILVALAAAFALGRSATVRRDRRLRLAIATLVALLPLLYAAAVLGFGRERLDTLRFVYVGKQLAFGRGIPLTIGGTAAAADGAEDLHASKMLPQALRIEPADAETAAALAIEPDAPVLRFAGTTVPAVRVDGELLASVPLAPGDRVRLAGVDPPIELEVRGDGLATSGAEGGSYSLPGRLVRVVRGPGRVVYLPTVLDGLFAGGERRGDWPYRSFLHRPRAFGPWHLVLRDAAITVVHASPAAGGSAAGGDAEAVSRLPAAVPVPRDFELELQVVGGNGTFLETLRRDRLLLRRERIEVRFATPQRRVEDLADERAPFTLGFGVPSAVTRHGRMVELDERSPRFRGFLVTLGFDPARDLATVGYLGEERPLPLGELYAFGAGEDQMLVRVERTGVPGRLLADLALLALFVGVFFGRSLTRDAALVAVVAPAGLLLASRLLFAYRAAENPPHFAAGVYGEARLASWLVPAGLLFGWSLAWLLRRLGEHAADDDGTRARSRRRALRWPLAGLIVAGVGCLATLRGEGNLPLLALAPWLAAATLFLAERLLTRPRARAWARRATVEGIPWRHRWLLLTGLLVVVVRAGAGFLGMPETLRLPAIDFRVLWTVPQLPLCALVLALSLHLLASRLAAVDADGGDDARRLTREWLGGLAAVVVFVALAFAAVAFLVRDLGLLIVHALPAALGLLLLVRWPRAVATMDLRRRLIYAAGIVVACLPLLLVIAGNVRPELAVRVVGWGGAAEVAEDEDENPARRVVDRTAQLGSTRAQQLFRLYMLANPELLRDVGLIPSERVAVHHQTLLGYAEKAGFAGGGFVSSRLPPHLGVTYLSDLVPLVFVLADFGVVGILALALVYVAFLAAPVLRAATVGGDRRAEQGVWIAAIALFAFVLPSLYMIMANLNRVLFTGKNCNLLALNSVSDVLESAALLALAVFGLGLARPGPARPGPARPVRKKP